MLTDFELPLDQLGNTGLWLATRNYDADRSYGDDATEDSIPVARRSASPFARFSASCDSKRAESETRTRSTRDLCLARPAQPQLKEEP